MQFKFEENLYLYYIHSLYYRKYIHYLKSNRVCLSVIFCLWNVSSKCSAIEFVLTIAKETYFSILVEKKIPPFEVEPDGSACILDKFTSLTRSLRNPCGIKQSQMRNNLL
jgi:hypothetical protein